MTPEDLGKYEVFDLHDMLVEVMNELLATENIPDNAITIREKKEYVLLLRNAIVFKRLEMKRK